MKPDVLGEVAAMIVFRDAPPLPCSVSVIREGASIAVVVTSAVENALCVQVRFTHPAMAHFLGSILLENAEGPREVKTQADADELAAAIAESFPPIADFFPPKN